MCEVKQNLMCKIYECVGEGKNNVKSLLKYALYKRTRYCLIFIFHVNGVERSGECKVVLGAKSMEMERKNMPQVNHE
jgi:hypothetical protein